MSGKRYRQRRRFMRTWGGHPNAGALWANHGARRITRAWGTGYLDMAAELMRNGADRALYSRPMGYVDSLNRGHLEVNLQDRHGWRALA